MRWERFCWEGPSVHVTLTSATHLSLVADRAHPLMETVFPGSRDDVLCHQTKNAQERFEEHNKKLISLQASICGMCSTYPICTTRIVQNISFSSLFTA